MVGATVALTLCTATGAQAFIYWANLGGPIGRANNDGTGADQTFIPQQHVPSGVRVNGTHIFWGNTNPGGTSVGRANLDGTNVNPNFITGASSPFGVAVTAKNIYWTNSGVSASIGRANLDGTGVDQNFVTGLSGTLSGVAVNDSFIYWGNQFSIGRANINGTSPNPNFIPAVGALVEDPAINSTHIFFTSVYSNGDSTYGPAGSVSRANLNGTGLVQNFIPLTGPGGVALFGGSIYWGNAGANITQLNSIGRANLDGTAVNQSLVPQANFPNGIAVDAGGAAVFGKLKCKGGCTLALHLPLGGTVTLKGKGIKTKSKTVDEAADIKLRVVAKGKARRTLNRRGKVKVSVSATLAPTGAPPKAANAACV